MPRCDAVEECEAPDRPVESGDSCAFAGYGFFVSYHVECCPQGTAPDDCLRHSEEECPHER